MGSRTKMDQGTAEQVKTRLSGQVMGSLGILVLNLGKKLGVWEAMRGGENYTPGQLASKTGLSQRYLEELLRAATLHDYIEFTEANDQHTEETDWDSGIQLSNGAFKLGNALEEVLFDEDNPNFYGNKLTTALNFSGAPYAKLMEAFKDDTGVPYTLYGEDFPKFVEDAHKDIYQNDLKDWLKREEFAEVRTKLNAGGSVLDLGCGSGLSSISFAEEFPNATIHAVDRDEKSIEKTKVNMKIAEGKNLIRKGQIQVHCCMAHEANISSSSVDVVLLFISLHDMNNPSEVLASVKDLLSSDGSILVLEFTSPDSFTSLLTGEDLDQRSQSTLLYSASVLHCLPVSKVHQPSQAIGTCLSTPTMKAVARKAGYNDVTAIKVNADMTVFSVKK